MNLAPTNKQEVFKVISSVQNKKSVGWDKILTKLLKTEANKLVSPLTLLINQSFKEGVFPEKLNYSQIFPIYEKKTKQKQTIIGQFVGCAIFLNFLKNFKL